MEWGTFWSLVLGAIVGTASSILTTYFAHRREAADRLRSEKRRVFAEMLTVVEHYRMDARGGTDHDADPSFGDHVDHVEAQIALLSPDVYALILELEEQTRGQWMNEEVWSEAWGRLRDAMVEDLRKP